jgi:hypothetical protein
MAWHATFETYHIPHKASLKAKLLLEIKKYAFYLFLGKWDIAFGSPCRVRLTASGILGFAKVAEIGCRRAPAVERFCGRNQVLAIDITVRVGLACRSGIGRAIDGTERAIGGNKWQTEDHPERPSWEKGHDQGCERHGGMALGRSCSRTY